MSLSGTYRECWERTVGHKGGLLVAIVNTLDPLLGIFANASILSQSLQLLLEGVNIYMSVVQCLLLITGLCLLPLCLMKNLGALAPFSTLGMAAVLVALGCMIVRYLDGSYQPGGEYFNDIPEYLQPSFGTESRPLSMDALPFVCMVYTSFDMHYNRSVSFVDVRYLLSVCLDETQRCLYLRQSAVLRRTQSGFDSSLYSSGWIFLWNHGRHLLFHCHSGFPHLWGKRRLVHSQ